MSNVLLVSEGGEYLQLSVGLSGNGHNVIERAQLDEASKIIEGGGIDAMVIGGGMPGLSREVKDDGVLDVHDVVRAAVKKGIFVVVTQYTQAREELPGGATTVDILREGWEDAVLTALNLKGARS